ncbi:hypothetical protein [uncultured Tolumonas sp.]|uniref:hypothetical protein n=1 Tax=uncultured Tolumonas sp. TaxID=263765 RepID=UPI00292FC640|nr:hypothetical protein [uncultured Tolumonas sp.]
MTFQKYADLLQGIGLPKFSQTDTVQNVVGLDTQQHGRWIRHPQAANQTGKFETNHQYKSAVDAILFHCFGARVGTKRLDRKAPPRVPVWAHVLRLPIHPVLSLRQGIQMIYTFLITANRGRIADFQRIRTISAFAKSEVEARQRLAGLPLIFMSRSPAQEVAA